MEVVHVFNKELKSILEAKLPVSRHKMSLITKSAMKALKFYKHVVQSVEKFIAKCSCEYKVPGLYVIDAIVRQSKHQYCDKDVFVPRFMRNIVTTFIHLSQCDQKDVTSIERVLRLWQQNGVFPTDLVESLLELVYDPNENNKIINACDIVLKLVNEWNVLKGKPEEKIDAFMPQLECIIPINETVNSEGGLIESITKLLTKFQAETGQDVSTEIDQIQVLHQKIIEQSALLSQGEMIDTATLSQLHQSMEELTKKAAKAAAVQQSKLAMLANDEKDHMNETSTDLEFIEQLQQMVDTLGQTRALEEELKQVIEYNQNPPIEVIEEVPATDTDFREFEEAKEPCMMEEHCMMENNVDVDMRLMQVIPIPESFNNHNDHDDINNVSTDKISRTSSVGSRKRQHSSPDVRNDQRKRPPSRERKKKEKKSRVTRKRWMPLLRDQFVGIISHTLFIGHLHKHVMESKLRTICEEFGSIAEFNMIPPRGCAFVSFDKRKGAYKAIGKMHELKFEGRDLKVAWAPNKGIKDEKEFKDFWVESEGCTYIPLAKFPIERSSHLTDGFAEMDVDSLTEEMKQAIYQFMPKKSEPEPPPVEPAIPLVNDVANQNIPLPSPVDTGASYYNHFTLPPIMLHPQIIPYPPPPPPQMFMGPSIIPMPMRPDMSNTTMVPNNQYMDYQCSISTMNSGMNMGTVCLDTRPRMMPPMPPVPVPYRPVIIDRTHEYNQQVRNTRPPFIPPALRPNNNNDDSMQFQSRARTPRPQARYPKPPPPGCPVPRPSMGGPVPRF